MEIEKNEDGLSYINVFENGYVRLDDWRGTDKMVMEESRVSTYNDSEITDEKLVNGIRFMMKDGFKHTSPFEQAVLWFKIKIPIHIVKQFNRHRTARILEKSARYTEMERDYYIPDYDHYYYWKGKDLPDDHGLDYNKCQEQYKEIREIISKQLNESHDTYEKLVNEYDVPKEVARTVLGTSLNTVERFQIDLHNLFSFLDRRVTPHAQYEAQQYAKAMLELAREKFPICVAEFENQVLFAETFSKRELEALNIEFNDEDINLTKSEMTNLDKKMSRINPGYIKEYYSDNLHESVK